MLIYFNTSSKLIGTFCKNGTSDLHTKNFKVK